MENNQNEIEKWVNEMFYRPRKPLPLWKVPSQMLDQLNEAIRKDKSITIVPFSEEHEKAYEKAVEKGLRSGIDVYRRSLRGEVTEDIDHVVVQDNRNCVFSVAKIEEQMKAIGSLEDIPHEVVQPLKIENK